MVVIAALLFVASVHGVAAWDATAPVWMDDEVGYLSNAQLLSGVGAPRSLGAIGYYSGWSVPLAPLWWIFDDPGQVYRAGIGLSVLCGVALVFPLGQVIRRMGLSGTWSLVLASVVALAPARSVMSGYVLAENFLALIVALTVLAAMRFGERSTPARAVWLGLSAAYAFFAHGRLLPLAVATVIWFLAVAARARMSALTGALVCISGSVLGFVVNSAVMGVIYESSTDREGAALGALLRTDVLAATTALIGLGWYLVVAWAALPLLGLMIVLWRAWQEIQLRRPSFWAWWSLAGLGVLLISISSVASAIERGSHRVDIYAYGRYVEPMVVVVAAVALAAVARGLTSRTRIGWAALSVGVAIAFLVVVAPRVPEGARVSPINVSGLMPWPWQGVDPAATGYPWVISTAAALVVVGVVTSVRHSVPAAVGVVAAAFVAASVAAEVRSLRVFDAPWRDGSNVLAQVVLDLDLTPVSYDLTDGTAVTRNGYQFWLAPAAVPVFRSGQEPPPTEAVISRRTWPLSASLGAKKLMDEPRFDEALWVLPGRSQDLLRARGALQHEPVGIPLPPEARAYSLSLVEVPDEPLQVSRRGGPRLRMILRHDGSSAPWPSMASSGSGTGYVRVVLYWLHDGGRSPQIVDLPESLLPGDEVSLDVQLRPPPDIGDGPTSIRIGLVEEGVGPFDAAGSEPLTLDVIVRR